MTVSTVTNNRIVGTQLIVDYDTPNGVVRALDCEDFGVEAGESLAVMGPSGCGKSTLLGLLAGLARPTQGSVTIGDSMVSEMSESERVAFRRRALGMVYQADNLLPHLTVEENVGLQVAIARPDADADPLALLERLGLAGLVKRFPDQLSGGQRQRVAVARAIIHRPAVILADEPTGALDGDSAARVIELIVEAHRDFGASLVIVTHDPAIAEHAERVVHLTRPVMTLELARAH